MPSSPSRSTPARLTTTATVKLSRRFLFTVGLIYILAGLFFRDPWKTDDVVGLATMVTAVQEGGLAWLVPRIGVLAHAQDGPLSMWAGALAIMAFTPLFELFTSSLDATIAASRLPNLLWFVIMTASIWQGTYLLGKRTEAQPLALPFGGEPAPHEYGRMIADAALLLIVATVGIIWRMHETSEVPAIIAFQALAFYGAARMLDRPRSGALILGFALGAAFLTRGWIGATPIMLAALCLFYPGAPLGNRRGWLLPAAGLCTAAILSWWLPARTTSEYWTDNWLLWNISAFGWPSPSELATTLRDLPWFLWPTWPFALMALWQWRKWLCAPHIAIPLLFVSWPLICMTFQVDAFEPEYSLMAVPSAVLAAFALPTLRRGFVNSLDWFAVMCFSLTTATVWLGWIALQTGWPAQISRNIARQTQGYDVFISWPAVLIALAGTAAWIMLVRWRLLTKPAGLWRGTALSAGGLIVTWLLLVTLWMPALDYVRSYRDVSHQLAQALEQNQKPGECIRTQGLGTGQRASFLVFDNINFRFDASCPLIVQQTTTHNLADGTAAFAGSAQELWVGKREADRHEIFRLLRVNRP